MLNSSDPDEMHSDPQVSIGVNEKVFSDAIHGAIFLHPLCVKIIDTPQFQRLRFIKTLGTCFFVFPAAAHNRFEHSLGVCHLAGELIGAIKTRQPELKIQDEDVLCVQIAGLCHDLGHGPFSHLWEEFVNEARPGKKWKHEEASVKMFDYLLEVNNLDDEFEKYKLGDKDKKFIRELIGGAKSANGIWPYEGRGKEKAFLYEVVANKRTGVDVDKWDYFVRDSYSFGMKVTFNYSRLMKFSRVINVEGEGWQICIPDKERDNLYDMFHARRTLHRTAYQHRVVKIIDSMLMDAFLGADKHIKYRGKNNEKIALADVHHDMCAYTNLTDDVFHRIILAEEDEPQLKGAQNILRNILTRKLYLYVGHTQPTAAKEQIKIDKADLLEALYKKIPKNSTLKEGDLSVQEVTLNYGMGDENPIEHARFYSKRSPNVAKAMQKEVVSVLLPYSFQEVIFHLLCKSYSKEHLIEAQGIFKAVCEELKMKNPSVDLWPNDLTPVKSDQL